MSVAAHLGIDLAEYDARIRTFIPYYEEMLDVAADAVPVSAKTIVDVGTGTGALASRCLSRVPEVRIVGIDADSDVVAVAARRLGERATFLNGSFLTVDIPRCDVIASSFALHHVRTRQAKGRLYIRFRQSLRKAGRLIVVDCQPSARPAFARAQFADWDAHLRGTYSPAEAKQLLAAWSHEDVYVPLETEIALMNRGGFGVDVLWRKGAFAVLVGTV
jgi:ubiquinone/menaquinone biosynthesis C-methylase UbiE